MKISRLAAAAGAGVIDLRLTRSDTTQRVGESAFAGLPAPADTDRFGTAVTEELPFTIRFSPDGATAYVANLKTGTVSVLDVASCTITRELDNNPGAGFGGTHGMTFAPSDSH